MGFSEQEKIAEYEYLRDFLDEVEIAAEVLPKGKVAEESALLVCLPTVEDIIDGENVDPEKMHVASAYLLDLDDTEMRLAKYLLLYAQIQVDISEMNTAEVLLLLNELNRTIRVGHYFLSKVEDVAVPMVQYRATVMAPEGEHFDGAIVADTILEMGVGYDIVKEALMQANEECKRREGK